MLLTLVLFPLLYLTLELPKRIINDAIAATGGQVQVFDRTIGQIEFLMLLCFGFLLAVFAHGLMKMWVNTRKGVLSERLLRRFRYQLIGRILRFPAPYFERTSQGELVSMITAESEPMGGLMGDALAQPVLQAGQMLTILGFLFFQSFAFGLAACALIPLQAWLIPRMQRKINLLNKRRVIEIRALAAEIGESAAGAATLRTNGGVRHRMAMISARLGRLFHIRLEIYQKKFFMKFTNNFITQLTPFFFFSIGGYLTIRGDVTLGALVAALAAYKDISSPWKELLAYYNQTQDMSVRWNTVTERFDPPNMIDAALFEGAPKKTPSLAGEIELRNITVQDSDGNGVIENLSLSLPAASSIAITAPSDEDRRALAEVLTRELIPTAGHVTLNGHALAQLHQNVISARIGYATSRPNMFLGGLGDNVLMPLKPHPKDPAKPTKINAAALRESAYAGNSLDDLGALWLDPKHAQADDVPALNAWWLHLLQNAGTDRALFRRALDLRLDATRHKRLADEIVKLRPKIAEAVAQAELSAHIWPFDAEAYNPALPVADNLLFATPHAPLTADQLSEQVEFLALLGKLDLERDLLALAVDVVELLRQIFGHDGTDHPLFRKLGLAQPIYAEAIELISKQRAGAALDPTAKAHLLSVPFAISAEKIGPAFPSEVTQRVLQMRAAHGLALQASMANMFTPLRQDAPVNGLSVLENALFGKISEAAGARIGDLRAVVADVLAGNDLDGLMLALISDIEIPRNGANVAALFAEPLALSRASIKRPDLLILDTPLSSFDKDARANLHHNLRKVLPDTTILNLAPSFEDVSQFDAHYEMQNGRITSQDTASDTTQEDSVRADLARKLQALSRTPLFSELDRKQLRLLAFGARWYDAHAGQYVFHKDAAPTDGAYLIIEGEADVLNPNPDGTKTVVATSGPGTLVGELALIRNVPRALDMRAKTDMRCLRIGADAFLAVVENDASTAYKLLQVVAGYVST